MQYPGDDYNPMYDDYPPLWNGLETLGVLFLSIIAIYLWIRLGVWYDDWWKEKQKRKLFRNEEERDNKDSK